MKIYLGYLTIFFGIVGLSVFLKTFLLFLYFSFGVNVGVESTKVGKIPFIILFIGIICLFYVSNKFTNHQDFNKIWETTRKEKIGAIISIVSSLVLGITIKQLSDAEILPIGNISNDFRATHLAFTGFTFYFFSSAILLIVAYHYGKRLRFAIKYSYDSTEDISEFIEQNPEALQYINEETKKKYGYGNATTIQ